MVMDEHPASAALKPPPTPLVCPACRSANTMTGAGGNGLCFDCRHEWDPAEVVALPRAHDDVADWTCPDCGQTFPGPLDHVCTDSPPGVEYDLAGVDVPDIFDGDNLTFNDLIGTAVTIYDSVAATVVAFPDDDHVLVDRGEGLQELVDMNDVRSATTPTDTPARADAPEDTETAAAFSQAVLALSNLMVRAGIVHGWAPESAELADLLAGVRDLAYDTTVQLAEQAAGDDENQQRVTDTEGETE